MLGFFSGIVLAVMYRKEGPQRPVYEWMEDEEDEKGGEGEGEIAQDPEAELRDAETERLRD